MRFDLPLPRLLIYLAAIGTIALIGFIASVAGLTLCSPGLLPGDEYWTWTTRLGEAASNIAHRVTPRCFTQNAAGDSLNVMAALTLWGVALFVIGVFIWETAGRELRRVHYRSKGGHALLAGEAGALAMLSRAERSLGAVCYLTPDEGDRQMLNRGHPFAEVEPLGGPQRVRAVLDRLGVAKARFIAATTRNDLVNIDIADDVLALREAASRSPLELLVRIEQRAVRSMRGPKLLQAANRTRVVLSVVSLAQMQIRRGAQLAMPGRYSSAGSPHTHVALCGSGPLMQGLAFHITRQAFGLETGVPLLSIVRTGANDFTAGALKRLRAASRAVEVQMTNADASDSAGLDRVLAAIALSPTPLAAVHCASEDPSEAEALAECWEQAFLRLKIAIPPIVAYSRARAALGSTGMIRTAGAIDLSEARAFASLLDRRAVATHDVYLRNQKLARGPDFGSLPAECQWQQLAPNYQDDNRHSADHVDYKLARIGYTAGEKSTDAGALGEREIETLAAVEHGRWAVGRYLDGWSYGESRDDTKFLHPSLVPYGDLSESEKQKDRDVVMAIPHLLSFAGQSLKRDFRCGLLIAEDGDVGKAGTMIADRLLSWQADHRDRRLLASLVIENGRQIGIAEELTARGIALEIVQHRPVFTVLEKLRNPALGRRAAELLRKAACIVAGRSASEHIEKTAERLVLVGEEQPSLLNLPQAACFNSKDMTHAGWLA